MRSRNALCELLDTGRPLISGILNVTPDSFSDGGLFNDTARAADRGLELVAEGADLIDIGGESTRPGSRSAGLAEELDRVIPVVEALAGTVPLSVDTSRPEVMRAAVTAGACMINDVRALRRPGAVASAAELDVPVCLMHMQRDPSTMQHDPRYHQVIPQVKAFLADRMSVCLDAGIRPGHLVIDPGFGFGKTLSHNVTLLASLRDLESLGAPIMVGLSRKSMLGDLTGRPVTDRLAGSVAAAVLAVQRGARILRVHDVAATRDAVTITQALAEA